MEQRLEMVGPNGLEPSTSSVSAKRSSQLSYPIPFWVTFPTRAIKPQDFNRLQGPQRYGVNLPLLNLQHLERIEGRLSGCFARNAGKNHW
jgi:hypothetical protein